MELSNPPLDFRTASAYQMPDRAQYEARTGFTPLELLVEEKFRSRAVAAVARDLRTMNQAGAASAFANLDAVCESLHHAAELPAEDTVFFEPGSNLFWIFPGKRAAPIA